MNEDLLRNRWALFVSYYGIRDTQSMRDLFIPYIRICIHFGSPIVGKYTALHIDTGNGARMRGLGIGRHRSAWGGNSLVT